MHHSEAVKGQGLLLHFSADRTVWSAETLEILFFPFSFFELKISEIPVQLSQEYVNRT